MSESTRVVLRLGAQAVDALPPRLRRSVRSVLGRPGPRPVALHELDAVLAQATALMGPAPDEARALLDGMVLALPTQPRDDPFSAAYREWTWELYRTISGRAAYETAHEASPFDLEAARERPFPYQTGSLALVGRNLVARGPRPRARLTAGRRSGGVSRSERSPRSCVPPAGGRGPPSTGGSPVPGSRHLHRAAC